MKILHPCSPPLRPLPCSVFSQSGVGGLLKLSPSASLPPPGKWFLLVPQLSGGREDPPLVTALPGHLLSISSALLPNPNGDGLQTRGMRDPLGVPCPLDQRASSSCSLPLAVSPPAAHGGTAHFPIPLPTPTPDQPPASASSPTPTLSFRLLPNKDVYSFNHQIKCLTPPSLAPGCSPLQLHLAGQWREKKKERKKERKKFINFY